MISNKSVVVTSKNMHSSSLPQLCVQAARSPIGITSHDPWRVFSSSLPQFTPYLTQFRSEQFNKWIMTELSNEKWEIFIRNIVCECGMPGPKRVWIFFIIILVSQIPHTAQYILFAVHVNGCRSNSYLHWIADFGVRSRERETKTNRDKREIRRSEHFFCLWSKLFVFIKKKYFFIAETAVPNNDVIASYSNQSFSHRQNCAIVHHMLTALNLFW